MLILVLRIKPSDLTQGLYLKLCFPLSFNSANFAVPELNQFLFESLVFQLCVLDNMENSNVIVLEYTTDVCLLSGIFLCSNCVTHSLSAFRRNLPRGHSFERDQERDP